MQFSSRQVLMLAMLLGNLIGVSEGMGAEVRTPYFEVQQFGVKQKMDLSFIVATAQSKEGYLWFGSPEGLFKYNGKKFESVEPREATEGRSCHVTASLAARDGTLWVGTLEQGVYRLVDDQWITYRRNRGLENDRVKCLFEDRRGVIWVTTDGGGIFYLKDDRFEALAFSDTEAPIHPTYMTQDRNGVFWVGTFRNGILRFDEDLNVLSFEGAGPTVVSLVLHPERGVWIGTGMGLWWVHEEGKERVPLLQEDGSFQESNYVTSLAVEPGGGVWVGTLHGLVFFRNQVQRRMGKEDGLGNGLITSVFLDREGSAWVGVEIGELFQVRRPTVEMISPIKEGIQTVHNLFFRKDELVWLATVEGVFGVNVRNGRTVFSPEKDGLPKEEVVCVYEDPKGRVWFATRFGELGYWEAGAITRLNLNSADTGLKSITLFYPRSDGTLWVGTAGGVILVDEEDELELINPNVMTHRQVMSFEEDRAGDMWVGTGHGLNRFQDGQWQQYRAIGTNSFDVVTALHADQEGGMWIGMQNGLVYFEDDQFHFFTQDEGGPPLVAQMVEDGEGFFWMGMGMVIARYSLADLKAVARGQKEAASFWLVSEGDGLISKMAAGYGSCGASASGFLGFGSLDGLMLVDPLCLPLRSPPEVLLQEIIVNGQTARIPKGNSPGLRLEVPPGYNRIEVHYLSSTFSMRESITYRFRLNPIDPEWQEVGDRSVAYFQGLPHGKYEFQVMSRNYQGTFSQEPARLYFQVMAPWWKTLWFRSTIIISILGVLGMIYFARVAHFKRIGSLKQEFVRALLNHQEQERKRIAKELHDGLGQNLLILTNLADLLVNDSNKMPASFRERANEIRDISRMAIEETREMTYNLRPADLDRAGLTCSIESMLERAGHAGQMLFDHHLENVDQLLPLHHEVMLYRISQELVHNILKHSQAKRAMFDLQRNRDGLVLEVADNGKGFEVERVLRESTERRGLGLESISERVEMMRGVLQIHSCPGEGTRVTIQIPIQEEADESKPLESA